MKSERYKRAFTLIEIIVVMLILGIGLMTFTPKIAKQAIGQDARVDFFEELIKSHIERSRELGRPVSFTGFKGSANILTHDGKRVSIPDTDSVQKAIVNGYETKGEEYSVRVYPEGLCDSFEILLKNGRTIESIPLLLKTRYKDENEQKK